jgi:hypothetical protein
VHRIFICVAVVAVLVGCSSDPEPVAYCEAVARHAEVMASTRDGDASSSEQDAAVTAKRAAMVELAGLAPAEIAEDWAAWLADDTELARRDLARERIAAFDAERC